MANAAGKTDIGIEIEEQIAWIEKPLEQEFN